MVVCGAVVVSAIVTAIVTAIPGTVVISGWHMYLRLGAHFR